MRLFMLKESPFTSAWKAFGDIVIENLSEESGALIGKVSGKVLNKIIPKKMATAITKLFKKIKPGEKITKLLTKGGYSGFLEEIGEERLGDLLRVVTGVEDFGKDNVFDSIIASIPDGEQLLSESIAFAVPGTTGFVVGRIDAKGKELEIKKRLKKQGLSKTESNDFVREIIKMQDFQEAKEKGENVPVESVESIRGVELEIDPAVSQTTKIKRMLDRCLSNVLPYPTLGLQSFFLDIQLHDVLAHRKSMGRSPLLA